MHSSKAKIMRQCIDQTAGFRTHSPGSQVPDTHFGGVLGLRQEEIHRMSRWFSITRLIWQMMLTREMVC